MTQVVSGGASDPDLVVLGPREVRDLLPMETCIALMRTAMTAALHPDAKLPLRPFLPLPGGPRGAGLSVMTGTLPHGAGFGAKVITVYPDNFQVGRPSHQGAVLLFDPLTGRLAAVMDAGEITAIRTAAASALATQLLAREGPAVLAILGYGEQAERHLESMALARPLREVRVWGRSPERARAFADRHGRTLNLPVEPAESVRSAIAGADIVCTTTAALEPILQGAWLEPGMHVNLVGSSSAHEREADDEVVVRGRFFVDYRLSTLAQAGVGSPGTELEFAL